jgi:hypothetical protein
MAYSGLCSAHSKSVPVRLLSCLNRLAPTLLPARFRCPPPPRLCIPVCSWGQFPPLNAATERPTAWAAPCIDGTRVYFLAVYHCCVFLRLYSDSFVSILR